ncbi:gliding motility-associated C-terminal domain-containing protein [Pontibacter harenae]|uniref:gliding motility-associated C-terminal domain-containing protein n=1 Tax=Pontibacter harenae TaxID=2894083 RepID=UPI001E51A8CD|nr:gliding motility-associated C-terminal domain-containing protein [Pontibacter harenae]MCC9167483.1 gliding motility-associated C-terminal domain-containing protein [Pontibacter harenae]
MRQRIFFFIFCILLSFQTYATHLVGGEFELQHLTGYNYRLSLNLYFDLVNGDRGARDPSIAVRIFSKSSNTVMSTVYMSIKDETPVNYTNIDCTTGELKTSKILYYEQVYLDPNRFNDPQGYYVVWERCCRNRTINNIVAPEAAAQTFYMEIPPVVINNAFFKNSSPKLFPPLSDYACANEVFYFDFSGTDPDGDSLVYDMVTPLNGYSTTQVPAPLPQPAPYTPIMWRPGYNTNNQVLGTPPMNIDKQTGRLTVMPLSRGLYVFGVRCQEFRNGVKIGEVRRDFQLLVKSCPTNEKPVVLAQKQGTKSFYSQNEVLTINPNGDRCIKILFTDPDPNEPLVLTARPVNFTNNASYSFQGRTSGTVNAGGATDTLTATICFEECFDTDEKVFLLDLIVRDDGCSLPKQDTVRVSFVIDPLADAPPNIALSTNTRVYEIEEGDIVNFDVIGTDPDQQIISLTASGVNFTLDQHNITFDPKTGIGPLTSTFRWEVDCDAVKQDSYLVDFLVSSVVCGKTVTRKETVEFRSKYVNNVPVISTDQQTLVINLQQGVPFEANLFGNDIDLNELSLLAQGYGFNLADKGMTFDATGGAGNAAGIFRWIPSCEDAKAGSFKVDFLLRENACVPSAEQKITMEFRVDAPNQLPVISTDKPDLVYEVALNEQFEANILGEDFDLDPLTLTAAGDGFNLADYGMNFESTNGNGTATGLFTWQANCEAFEQGSLRVTFMLKEDACAPPSEQRLVIEFKVKVPDVRAYVPANIFTPNEDGKNDFFEMPSLPMEFCTATFMNIKIYNRWGKEVFTSYNSNFKWDGKGVNDGVYFYVIDYRTSKFKGSVTLVR